MQITSTQDLWEKEFVLDVENRQCICQSPGRGTAG